MASSFLRDSSSESSWRPGGRNGLKPNTDYRYYATLALFHHPGPVWPQWNEQLTQQLLAHQQHDGRSAGSWPPQGEWTRTGGRIYQTALCTLMLEVYYRYLPLYSATRVADDVSVPGPDRHLGQR